MFRPEGIHFVFNMLERILLPQTELLCADFLSCSRFLLLLNMTLYAGTDVFIFNIYPHVNARFSNNNHVIGVS